MKLGLGCILLVSFSPLLSQEKSIGQVPEPARAPVSWELKFDFHDPQRITLTLPGDDHPSTFWYILYRVENDAGKDIQFFPAAEIVTASLQVVQGGDQISPSVYDAIKGRHKVTHPFLQEPRHVSGTLLQGEDNARDSVVVFRQFDLRDNEFSVFFSGLSGEIKRALNPSFDNRKPESGDNSRLFTMRKTLAIKYRLPGDPKTRPSAKPIRMGREWVMR